MLLRPGNFGPTALNPQKTRSPIPTQLRRRHSAISLSLAYKPGKPARSCDLINHCIEPFSGIATPDSGNLLPETAMAIPLCPGSFTNVLAPMPWRAFSRWLFVRCGGNGRSTGPRCAIPGGGRG